jgi:hypothetical protein
MAQLSTIRPSSSRTAVMRSPLLDLLPAASAHCIIKLIGEFVVHFIGIPFGIPIFFSGKIWGQLPRKFTVQRMGSDGDGPIIILVRIVTIISKEGRRFASSSQQLKMSIFAYFFTFESVLRSEDPRPAAHQGEAL